VDELQALSPRVVLHPTRAAGDARRIAAELSAAGEPMVVAAGGDGTINEVVNGLADAGRAEVALGLLPSGTMNVFAMDLGLPSGRLDECWAAIERGNVRKIDLWQANGTHFVQLAGSALVRSVMCSVVCVRFSRKLRG
jgi:diacylglycerol kinase family enzyme